MLLRAKIAAVVIGLEGVAVSSLLQNTLNLAIVVSGLGLRSSAVRYIATSALDSPSTRSKLIRSLRGICWLTGITGSATLLLLAPLVSWHTFASSEYTNSIRLISIAILFETLAGGQLAILQGLRRIRELAKAGTLSAILSTAASLIIYSILGTTGIGLAILVTSAISLSLSIIYSRFVTIDYFYFSWKEFYSISRRLVALGIVLAGSSIVASATTYQATLSIRENLGFQAVGWYTAAFALSGAFVGFVLQAMGSDFYPRLSQLANDNQALNRLINEQTEIGLLVTSPGIMLLLAFAPAITTTLYTNDFENSIPLLQLFTLGCLGKVISWPMAYAYLAKGKGLFYGITEISFQIIHVILILVGISLYELKGAAMAFPALYLLYSPFMLISLYYQTNFRLSRSTRRAIFISALSTFLVFALNYTARTGITIIASLALISAYSIFSVRTLAIKTNSDSTNIIFLRKIPILKQLLACQFSPSKDDNTDK